jgi:hypothetical protein
VQNNSLNIHAYYSAEQTTAAGREAVRKALLDMQMLWRVEVVRPDRPVPDPLSPEWEAVTPLVSPPVTWLADRHCWVRATWRNEQDEILGWTWPRLIDPRQFYDVVVSVTIPTPDVQDYAEAMAHVAQVDTRLMVPFYGEALEIVSDSAYVEPPPHVQLWRWLVRTVSGATKD